MKSSSRIHQSNENLEANTNTSKNIAHDLEELVSLAETTSKEIENMREAIVNSRESFIYKIIVAYGAAIAASFIYISVEKYESLSFFTIRFIQILIAGAGFVMLIYIFKNLMTAKRIRNKITKELKIEKEVHSKLISMVFDQFNRAKQLGTLTLISQALFEIRIQRLKTDI